MRQGNRGVYPLNTESVEFKGSKKRRCKCKGVYGRTDIMAETRQGQFLCPYASTNSFSGFKEKDRPFLPGMVIAAASPLGPDPTTTASYS